MPAALRRRSAAISRLPVNGRLILLDKNIGPSQIDLPD
jgi:hypothetical protein